MSKALQDKIQRYEAAREQFDPKRYKRGGGYSPDDIKSILRIAGMRSAPTNEDRAAVELWKFEKQKTAPADISGYVKDGRLTTSWLRQWHVSRAQEESLSVASLGAGAPIGPRPGGEPTSGPERFESRCARDVTAAPARLVPSPEPFGSPDIPSLDPAPPIQAVACFGAARTSTPCTLRPVASVGAKEACTPKRCSSRSIGRQPGAPLVQVESGSRGAWGSRRFSFHSR